MLSRLTWFDATYDVRSIFERLLSTDGRLLLQSIRRSGILGANQLTCFPVKPMNMTRVCFPIFKLSTVSAYSPSEREPQKLREHVRALCCPQWADQILRLAEDGARDRLVGVLILSRLNCTKSIALRRLICASVSMQSNYGTLFR